MKNEFFATLEKTMNEVGDKALEKWSSKVSESEYENIETVILEFRWDVLSKFKKELGL